MKFQLGHIETEQVVKFYQVAKRTSNAEAIPESHIRKDAPDMYIVRSSKGRENYMVDLRGGTCSCPDWTHRGCVEGFDCKHIVACRRFAEKEKALDDAIRNTPASQIPWSELF